MLMVYVGQDNSQFFTVVVLATTLKMFVDSGFDWTKFNKINTINKINRLPGM